MPRPTKPRAPKGISAFVVETGTPGFNVAQKLDKMGFRGSTTAELVFNDCRVPAENRVGDENAGVSVVMSGLDLERAIVAMINLGMAERAFALALDYAKTRKQFGKPIGEFQLMQAKLADMYTAIETMRTFCYRTLAEANDLEVGGGGRGDIHKLTASCILYAAEGCTQRDRIDAVQVFGGAGYMRETEINRLYRASKLLEIGAGTSEIRKLIIGSELMRWLKHSQSSVIEPVGPRDGPLIAPISLPPSTVITSPVMNEPRRPGEITDRVGDIADVAEAPHRDWSSATLRAPPRE